MKTADEINSMLAHCIGTTCYHIHRTWFIDMLHTDGVTQLAEDAECYWLLTAIASHLPDRKLRNEAFQVWTLTRKPNRINPDRAILICTDGNDNLLIQQIIPFTDFPLDSITFYYESDILMLPSER